MRKRRPFFFFFALALLTTLGAHAQTVSISGLYTTGVKDNGNLYGDDKSDAHYVVNASGSAYDGSSRTVTGSAIPGAWTSNTSNARWITTHLKNFNGADPSRPNGLYDYTLTFTMPAGAQLATVSIAGSGAVDDSATIWVNGTLVSGQTLNGYGSTNSFTLNSANASFVSGANTIMFRVNNSGGGPSGLLISSLSGTAVVPEVGAFLPVAGALALLAAVRVSQRRTARR